MVWGLEFRWWRGVGAGLRIEPPGASVDQPCRGFGLKMQDSTPGGSTPGIGGWSGFRASNPEFRTDVLCRSNIVEISSARMVRVQISKEAHLQRPTHTHTHTHTHTQSKAQWLQQPTAVAHKHTHTHKQTHTHTHTHTHTLLEMG